MNFKIKAAVQRLISVFPMSHHLNRLLQTHVSRSLPISDAELETRREIAEKHLGKYSARRGCPPAKVLDIGAGSDLSLAILMGVSGASVVASDVSRLASKRLIADMLERLNASSLEAVGVEYVVYVPPRLPFPDGAFDLVTSTSVLEHVPTNQLPTLLTEIRRVLKPTGITSHHIAHKDHWSDVDPAIHAMNYVRYDASEWKRYNPPIMFQNRVMHSQYCEMFDRAGFDYVVDIERSETPPSLVDASFAHFSTDDLSTTHSWFTAEPA